MLLLLLFSETIEACIVTFQGFGELFTNRIEEAERQGKGKTRSEGAARDYIYISHRVKQRNDRHFQQRLFLSPVPKNNHIYIRSLARTLTYRYSLRAICVCV